ncbi:MULTISPECIES: CCA tRNA nucleotidyltransferase [Clostridium]|jgi:tRNA nucleotidyltransferase (CCA-adding enzyme)|uniref:CCA tRNA nucleotidyltransferase n=1 Tax=Clostridium lapidicellarium TaxID=3240931 RepID=A0ABV4DSN5_9CLOT|nr:CCA tRNA nucleotidyltransferase [uncultured Clostridium sp.]NLU08099.1 CCA tRNA nucleotidyltransferase [Clostridiales bacterium]
MEISKSFGCGEMEIINEVGEVCRHRDIKSYIVGGAVRDAILGNRVKDIDICLEEDPKIILDDLWGLKYCQYHSEFQTAFLTFENGVSIDLIRCRKEHYCRDGALPSVSPSHIYGDLYRRDFTVNALAYDMEKGYIIDIYGGMKDLRDKVLRKIHPGSYNEDPTRIFRAVKYAVRYGLKLEDEDEIEKCVCGGAFDLVSNDRIVKEIYLLCCEKKWRENIYLCSDLKIFDVDKCLLEMEFEGEDHSDNVDLKILRLLYCLRDKKYSSVLAENSVLNKKLKSAAVWFNENFEKTANLIMNTMDNYKLYMILNHKNDYELVLLSWNSKLSFKICNYIYNLKGYKPSLNGRYIISMGVKDGKSIGKILKNITGIELNSGIKCGQKYLAEYLGENM